MDDVHSEGHIDGDGGVVGRHAEGVRTTWQDISMNKTTHKRNNIVFSSGVVLHRRCWRCPC